MSFNINEAIKKAEKEYGFGKGEYFKAQDGDNWIRVLSPFEGYQSLYQGKPTFKFVAWIIDRKDSKIKPYFMPMTVVNAIAALQESPKYKFEDMPMPYDINVNAKGAGSKEVIYNVLPDRTDTDLTTEETNAYAAKMTIGEFIQKLKERDAEQGNAPQKPSSNVAETKVEESKPNPFIEEDDEIPFP